MTATLGTAPTASPEPTTTMRVGARRALATDVVEFRLEPLAGPTPAWAPGAHVDLVLPDGVGGPAGPVRQYSLCGDPADRSSLTFAVLREPDGRGGSAWLHDHLDVGATLTVRGPRNHFALEPAQRYLFIAGGIGVTPLLPMLRAVDAAAGDWQLVYGGRTRASMAYLDELARFGGRVSVRPQDETGLLDLAAILGDARPGTAVYCCGPGPLLDAVEQRFATDGEAGALHVERFAPRQLDVGPDTAFDVECAVSGTTVHVAPGVSILQAVEAAGIGVLSSCQEGTCGTCETVVVAGEPDHRDSVLSREEQAANEVMMICCSRARSPRLVLEL